MDEYLAKGKRGEVFLRDEKGKKVLVKIKNPKSDVDTIANEARFNELLNKKGIGPQFLSYDKDELVREYVVGEEFRKWAPSAEKEAVRHVLLTNDAGPPHPWLGDLARQRRPDRGALG